MACFVSGLGIVTIKCKPLRRIGGRGGVLLILVLSIALITISIPTSTAQQAPDAVGNPYGFTGESQFGEADDLIFLRARYYSPSTGRFISRDPINIAGGINLYGYVGNNPVRYRDPSGLLEPYIIIGIGIIIYIGAKIYEGLGTLCRGIYSQDKREALQNPLLSEQNGDQSSGDSCPTDKDTSGKPIDKIRKYCKKHGLYGPPDPSDVVPTSK